MARIEFAEAAVRDLERLIATHSLPSDTKRRVSRSLRPLNQFPLIGASLTGRWEGLRFILGPWRWFLIVYVVLDDESRVVFLTMQDARSSTAAAAEGR